MNYKRIVPNTISGISLVLGVFSIFYTQEQNYFMAAVCIVLSVVADSLDGRAARALGVQGPFGVEMDSLCDLGAFGVAPAILIYQFALTDLGWWGKIIAGLYTFFGAMRLARFNVNTSVVHGYFQGMPIPAGACCIATYVISGFNYRRVSVVAKAFRLAFCRYVYLFYCRCDKCCVLYVVCKRRIRICERRIGKDRVHRSKCISITMW